VVLCCCVGRGLRTAERENGERALSLFRPPAAFAEARSSLSLRPVIFMLTRGRGTGSLIIAYVCMCARVCAAARVFWKRGAGRREKIGRRGRSFARSFRERREKATPPRLSAWLLFVRVCVGSTCAYVSVCLPACT